MPIGGGNFTLMNKVLPGAYTNFVSVAAGVSAGSRGVVALPLSLNWGEEGKVIRMDAGDFAKNSLAVFGYEATAPEMLPIREAFKRAKTVLVYRVNGGGAKATKTVGGVIATAKYSGTRGNDIKIGILANPDGGSDVVTYIDNREVDRQNVTAVTELVDNDFVTFSGVSVTASAAIALAGGTNGNAIGSTYSEAFAAFEVENFNVIGFTGTDTSVMALLATFVKRLRDDEGKKVVAVMGKYASANYEGIISVKNGVILEDGTELTAAQAAAWVAGATAGAEINESLTNTVYEGAVDVTEKYTKSQYEAALKGGEFVFYAEDGRVRVLDDINTLVTFANGKTEDWTSNRLVRVMDGWANDVARIFGSTYMGLATNDDTGRQLFKADLVSLGKQYEGIGAISEFDSADITVSQGTGKRDVVVDCALKPNDSMTKLYMTVQVQ